MIVGHFIYFTLISSKISRWYFCWIFSMCTDVFLIFLAPTVSEGAWSAMCCFSHRTGARSVLLFIVITKVLLCILYINLLCFQQNLSFIALIHRRNLSCLSDNWDSLAVLSLLRTFLSLPRYNQSYWLPPINYQCLVSPSKRELDQQCGV